MSLRGSRITLGPFSGHQKGAVMTTPATNARPTSGLAVGITVTAAIILFLAGFFDVMTGIVGLVTNEFYVTTQHWVFQLDATTWGWVHIVVGLVAVLAGVGLLYGALWARILGVIIAALSIIANFLWLPYYPIWAIVIIIFDLFVIWALTAHGRDITAASDDR